MAAETLPVLSHPSFPQVFTAAMDWETSRILAAIRLHCCDFEDEYCDCRDLATVHHLASEQDFCLRHFEAVSR
jgi:hypothetical protein